jgi:hypothetical protein
VDLKLTREMFETIMFDILPIGGDITSETWPSNELVSIPEPSHGNIGTDDNHVGLDLKSIQEMAEAVKIKLNLSSIGGSNPESIPIPESSREGIGIDDDQVGLDLKSIAEMAEVVIEPGFSPTGVDVLLEAQPSNFESVPVPESSHDGIGIDDNQLELDLEFIREIEESFKIKIGLSPHWRWRDVRSAVSKP